MNMIKKDFWRYISLGILGMLDSAGTILADAYFVSDKLGGYRACFDEHCHVRIWIDKWDRASIWCGRCYTLYTVKIKRKQNRSE